MQLGTCPNDAARARTAGHRAHAHAAAQRIRGNHALLRAASCVDHQASANGPSTRAGRSGQRCNPRRTGSTLSESAAERRAA